MSDQPNTKIPFEDIALLLCRSELYGALALFYRHPSSIKAASLMKEQRAVWNEAILRSNFPNKNPLKTSWNAFIKHLDQLTLQKWISVYEDCFAYTAHGIVSSYELEYGEEHTFRQPQQLGDIAAFYQAFGLKVNDKSRERVDHISVQCEFMHFLNFKNAYALEHHDIENAEVCRQASCRFLFEHLGKWTPSFALRLSKHAGSGLFRHLADFTSVFIAEDCRQQGIMPGLKDLPLRSVAENMDSGCVTCSLKTGFQC